MPTDKRTHARPDTPSTTGPDAVTTPPYDHTAVERAARELWETHDIHRYDPAATGPVFSVDTPPPYVSASHLHVGHAMSYSQPDFVVRYRRMRGDRIFYPMGFDDNGLPTERYVEKKYGIRAADLPRAEFVAMCLAETRETAGRYADLWRRLGLSVDWALSYSTIDERCRRTAQGAFTALYAAGHVRRATDPILWCPECRTSLAQADIDDLTRTGKIYDIRFAPGGTPPPTPATPDLTIATTRPELLPGCVALYCHPADDRYATLVGGTARVPLFDHEVPILADEAVDPDFGTGLMMACTFGDGEDVTRWRRDGLDLRMVLGPDGRLTDTAGELAGLPVTAARTAITRRLAEHDALGATRSLRQVVGVHERCGTPVEFQIRPQWFVAVRERRDALLARARELTWVPPFMRRRLEDWITGLKWDWNISRQRHYGVPFPVWYCADCDREILAEPAALPVDPVSDPPPVTACPDCGGGELRPETDVLDTWMTSSLSPQINDGWAARGFTGDGPVATMSLRVQGFEIIRTWLFYTLVQSHLLADRLPWTAAMISGWGLNEQGKKISKRDLDASTADGFNRYVPDQVIERYGADALRLWATRARVGNDLRYHEKDVRTGRKLAVKLWNVGRFVELHAGTADPANPPTLADRTAVDRWVLSHLADTVRDTTAAFDEYDYTQAYRSVSTFFWSILCDRYIELVKTRFTNPAEHTDAERAAARATLREVYRTVLGLLAPFAPFVTEDQYQRLFRTDADPVSLHLTRWPDRRPEWTAASQTTDRVGVDRLVTVLDAVRALRTRHRLGGGAPIDALVLDARTPDAEALADATAEALRAAARARSVRRAPADTASGVDDLYVAIVP
ncbi:valine--tRNA ligase [Plantactinospora sp. GCM10030261]|uniref:valine--tRNA ligase n=1 Tax=Plantactinospora sp. GCM10030261 TaxID=3273420 RepID=UPI0036111D82